MGYTLHFISHTHWDREWFMGFEDHRFKLVEFMDALFELLETDENYKCFHLDGQIILLEDYLEIRPDKIEDVRKYVSEGRLFIGPWYVLQDEFLTSGEANIRNLLYGLKYSKKYGPVCHIGYFPDTFGSFSQMPQILKGFGIDFAVVGRGANPADDGKYKSEFLWQAPDGSEVTSVFLANWYNNASEIPSETERAIQFVTSARDKALEFTESQHLLMMNGSDHQPVQKNLHTILEKLRKNSEKDVFLHSNFEYYFNSISQYKSMLHLAKGELTGQKSEGLYTLVNTASSRIYLKQMNAKAQNLLEKWAEPIGSMSFIMGDNYRKEFFDKAWLYLMQNHPHDSICGCSIDDVHEEMEVRFKKSIAIAQNLIDREISYITKSIDTAGNEGGIPIVVFNPLGWKVSEKVDLYVDLDEFAEINPETMIMVDNEGNTFPCDIYGGERVFTYELPEDSFRKVKYVKRFQLSFIAENLPPLGYKTYWLRQTEDTKNYMLTYGETFAENEFLHIDIEKNGSLCLLDKSSGCTYRGLNILEDAGDIGDEYNFISPDGDKAIVSDAGIADISVFHAGKTYVIFEIRYKLMLPECSWKEKRIRSDKMKKFTAVSYVTLGALSRRIDITTEFDNQIANHRLRALFQSNIESNCNWADSQFDIVQRNIQPYSNWKNPSNCQRQQAYVELFDRKKGLIIANRGLPEYEIIKDGRNTIALTLLRAVGELGDWGDFPTPGAQCFGKQRMEYSIIPYSKASNRRDAQIQAYLFSIGPLMTKIADIHDGKYKPEHSFIGNCGRNVTVSAFKKSEERESLILRIYNPTETDDEFRFAEWKGLSSIDEINLNEERIDALSVMESFLSVKIPSKKIKTFEIILNREEEGDNIFVKGLHKKSSSVRQHMMNMKKTSISSISKI